MVFVVCRAPKYLFTTYVLNMFVTDKTRHNQWDVCVDCRQRDDHRAPGGYVRHDNVPHHRCLFLSLSCEGLRSQILTIILQK